MNTLDTHFHYDFLPPQARGPFLEQIAGHGVGIIAQTLTPSGFLDLEEAEHARLAADASLTSATSVTSTTSVTAATPAAAPPLSVGYHPWYMTPDYGSELNVFADALSRTRFVGEIGLDFSPRRLEPVPAELQMDILRQLFTILQGSESGAPTVLSIHTVRSASQVLDLAASCGLDAAATIPVFHRFAGTSDELTRLIRAGGYISVSRQMLESKRGRAYVTQVPADRLLLETDLPSEPASADASAGPAADVAGALARGVAEALRSTIGELAQLRGIEEAELASQIDHNTIRVFGADTR
ncbi:TatD family hydrolase [Trueperella pecoris]|uniref:TatD family hydrolase n=1 Tax=Trueperella pecoris TaxID=2733571 RepID=A0A7M1QUA5_9ACTO|nr:TatD family hydrolase [Trueperella pecoris]QOR45640.1 TatD family hydrolase [Trueperella pecoris]